MVFVYYQLFLPLCSAALDSKVVNWQATFVFWAWVHVHVNPPHAATDPLKCTLQHIPTCTFERFPWITFFVLIQHWLIPMYLPSLLLQLDPWCFVSLIMYVWLYRGQRLPSSSSCGMSGSRGGQELITVTADVHTGQKQALGDIH